MRFHKILVALDFSETSREALRVATELADGGDLVLVHVWQPTAHLYGGPSFPVSFAEDFMRQGRESLDAWAREAERAGAHRVRSHLLTGSPWHEVVELARKDEDIDLIVVGTHGHTGLRHVLLGSVAERIVRHAPCPVLVARSRRPGA